jgi:hypothetical protein
MWGTHREMVKRGAVGIALRCAARGAYGSEVPARAGALEFLARCALLSLRATRWSSFCVAPLRCAAGLRQ